MGPVESTHRHLLQRAKGPLPITSLEVLSSSEKSCRQAVPWRAHAANLILSSCELCATHAWRTDNCKAQFWCYKTSQAIVLTEVHVASHARHCPTVNVPYT